MRNKVVFFLMLLALVAIATGIITPYFNHTTKVIAYKPNIIPTTQQSGSCWTGAISVTRPDAWRCMQENTIYDPCFSSTDPNIVICDADPSQNKAGFALQLTKPLPEAEQVQISGENSWLLQLADGTVCRPFTGTMPIIHTATDIKAIKYACDSTSGLLDGSIKTGKIWTAKQVFYRSDKNGISIEKIQDVDITKAWK